MVDLASTTVEVETRSKRGGRKNFPPGDQQTPRFPRRRVWRSNFEKGETFRRAVASICARRAEGESRKRDVTFPELGCFLGVIGSNAVAFSFRKGELGR